MAEETDQEHGAATAGSVGGAAVALAMNGSSREEADAFLRKQSRLADLQIENLQKQDEYEVSHLRWRRFNDQMRGALQILLVAVGAALVVGLGALIWTAHDAHGLVADPLKTPPDFAAKGLDGTVLSQQLLDRLNQLVAEADQYDFETPDSIAGSWNDQSTVQIPETGVSINELSRLLRDWLGSETHVSGEVFRTETGIAVTVRAGNNVGVTFKGREADLDKLMDRAADSLFKQTQPFSYVSLHLIDGKFDPDTIDVARRRAESGSPAERGYGYQAWAEVLLAERGDYRAALEPLDEAVRIDPDDPNHFGERWDVDVALDHAEAGLSDGDATLRLAKRASQRTIRPELAGVALSQAGAILAEARGAFLDGAKGQQIAQTSQFLDLDQVAPMATAYDYSRAHDPAKARAILSEHSNLSDAYALAQHGVLSDGALPVFFLRAATDDWKAAVSDLVTTDQLALKTGTENDLRHTLVWPWLAYAWSQIGNLKGAQELIATTPHDCTRCLEMRGRIAAVAGNVPAATFWFDRALKDAPSVPFAVTDWGEMLMHRGEYDRAIAKFQQANFISPHFADPLEMWGEALMLKNRSDLALAKFEDANKYAPNWGRLHMKWGEALGYVGRKDAARAQYRIASTLDLSVADEAELTRDVRR